MTKKVVTLLVPNSMGNKISKFVLDSGYGMRGKSRWICDAIYDFLQLDNYHELAIQDNEFSELSETLSIRISEDIEVALKQAIIDIRRLFPDAEGLKSSIIRASILQRMVKEQLQSV